MPTHRNQHFQWLGATTEMPKMRKVELEGVGQGAQNGMPRPWRICLDEDVDGFCEVHVNILEGFWSSLRSWLCQHRGISQEKLPAYLSFFQFVHDTRRRGKALLGAFVGALVE